MTHNEIKKATSGYDGCLMSCKSDELSGIVGVMLDGFCANYFFHQNSQK